MWNRRRSAFLALAVLGGALAAASAQERNPDIKLHEDLQPPKSQVARTAGRLAEGIPVVGPAPEALQNPTAIVAQDKLLPEPNIDQEAGKSEPVHGRKEFGVDRQTETKPDYRTAADDQLKYIGVFNPSIVPFKRMSTLDAVRDNYSLYASSTVTSDVPVGGSVRPNHDRFWASIMVVLKPGLDVAIPSVAPGMRILSYKSKPAGLLSFSKDIADNFYVRTDEVGAGNTYRVVFLVEASPYYFAPSVSDKLRIRDIPEDIVPPLPAKVQRVADQVLDEMRLHRNMFALPALNKLVHYFRSFDAKSPPPNTGDVYLDLYKSQAGVCRHRSFAFMVTANALGIPTRYVSNETHAWVEVWMPGSDWMRIDLGGAATELHVENVSDKSMYQPRSEDPFSQPESYQENYTRLEGDVTGLRDDQIAERQSAYEGEGNGESNGSFFGNEEAPESEGSDEGEAPLTGPGTDLPSVPAEELEGKEPCYLSISSSASDGYRGESITVQGVASDGQNGIAGLRINVFLAPAGNEGNGSVLVGVGLSDEEGHFETSIDLPSDLETKRYELFVSTPGNDLFQPALSQ